MNLISWIFYIISRVMVVPMGSVNEIKATQEDAEKWYKAADDENHKFHKLKKNIFEFWAFKLFLLVFSIYLIPKLKDIYNGKPQEDSMFEEEK
jgi:hypothetical protein